MAPRSASPDTPKPALTARWTNLLLLTYEAPEQLLRRHIHPALELDRWAGQTHVSLVAFDFENTRLFGVSIPGFMNFPEVNLRTYVRHGERRGVVFIRELVPSRVIAAVARVWYNEPYQALPMSSKVDRHDGRISTDRRWRTPSQLHQVQATGAGAPWIPHASSVEHYFKEHEWGFGRSRSGRLLVYRVEHPEWTVREVTELAVTVGFGATYGPDWEFLNQLQPTSVVFSEGSPVAVYSPSTNR